MYKNIWILRNLWLGDSIVYTPFLKKLRKLYPYATITIYTGKNKVSDIFFKRIPYIDNVVFVDAQINIFKKIIFGIKNFKKHDLFIDTFESTKIWGIFSWFLWKKSIWFSHSGYHTLNIDSHSIDKDMFIIQKEFLIFQKLWYSIDITSEISLLDFPIQKNNKKNLLQKLWTNTILSETYVCIHPSSDSRYTSRKFEVEKWNRIIQSILHTGKKVVIIWTNSDAEIINQLINNPDVIKLHTLSLTIRETGFLIQKALLFIWINSWPAWIAVAVKTKSIIINWPSLVQWEMPKKLFPHVESIRGQYTQWDCYHNPCDLFECKYNKWKIWLCMKNISSDQIIEKINEIL